MQRLSINIIGSPCAVSDSYKEFVEEIADSLGLEYSIMKTESEEEAARYGVEIGCLYGYCPGCQTISGEDPDRLFTPALVIDGKLVFSGGYPGDEMVRKTLIAYR